MNTIIPLFRKPLAALCSLALLLTLSACDGDDGPGVPPPVEVNAAEYISARSDLDQLNAALQAAELTGTLEGEGPFTVFAPSNNAFSGVNVDALTGDTELLSKILTTHVVPDQSILAGDISDGQSVTTIEGTDVTFSTADGGVQISVGGATATVQTTDLETTNGVIHIIDNVLIGNTSTAERAKATSATSTLSAALGAADLEGTLDDTTATYTVFAPVNDAFSGLDVDELLEDANSDLLSEILTYHVIPQEEIAAADITDGQTATTVEGGTLTFAVAGDGTVTVNGKTVTTADIQTTNGVIHLIDGPLLETLDVASYASVASATEALATAVTDANLASVLGDGAGPLTVFAPVNSAFGALDANGDGEVNGDELSDTLRERVLKYHVVGENIPLTGAGLMDGDTRVTLDDTGMENQSLTFSVEDDSITAVNGADIAGTVEVADGNATIHLLNEVLLQSTNIAQRASLDPNLTALVDAAGTAELASGAGTLGDDGTDFTVFAPPNGAFSGLDAAAFTGEDGSQPLAFDIVRYHAIQGTPIAAADISDGQTAASPVGPDLEFRAFADGSVTVNGVPVTTTDIQARNGIIHLIDGVLLGSLNIAQRATVEPALSTLVTAVGAADASIANTLTDEDNEYTVFAPTNDALGALDVAELTGDEADADDQALVTDLLLNHVLSGSVMSSSITNGQLATTLEANNDGESENLEFSVASDGSVSVNGVSVTTADIQTVNGVVHVIDGVLLGELNIVQRVVADPAFSSLQAAVGAADPAVATTLSDESSDYTVFAPTNDAFGAFLGDGSLGDFTPAQLATVLQYHALSGTVLSTDLTDGQTATSLEGTDLTFGVNGGVTVDPDDEAASVVTADVPVENGVVHVIDTVLQPGDQSSSNGGNGGS